MSQNADERIEQLEEQLVAALVIISEKQAIIDDLRQRLRWQRDGLESLLRSVTEPTTTTEERS